MGRCGEPFGAGYADHATDVSRAEFGYEMGTGDHVHGLFGCRAAQGRLDSNHSVVGAKRVSCSRHALYAFFTDLRFAYTANGGTSAVDEHVSSTSY